MKTRTERRVAGVTEREDFELHHVYSVTTFSELPRLDQREVVIVHQVPEFFDVTPDGPVKSAAVSTEILRSVSVEGWGITDEDLHRVAELLPTLAQIAYAAAQPEMDHTAMAMASSRVGKEVLRAAEVYRAAVAQDTSPLKAVMDELNLSKPTASRRIRAAKDAGLLPEKASDLR